MKIEIDRILCPIDFSDVSRRALRHAIATARWYGSRLSVLYVLPFLPAIDIIPSLAGDPARQVRLASVDLRSLQDRVRRFVAEAAPGHVPIDVLVTDADDLSREILEQAGAMEADLLVMGSHGRSGFDRLMLGSVAEKVMRRADCPVMVVPPHAEHPVATGEVEFDSILCAVDFSECSLIALTYALSMAEEADARITVVNVIEKPPELDASPVSADFNVDEVRAAAEAERLRRLRGLIPKKVLPYCAVDTAVWEGRAWRGILALAADRQSDLIVMGVRGRGAVDLALFGSNTHDVIRGATCPVLTVPES
jgi:nucleotide-binding universal stress UspA family protein